MPIPTELVGSLPRPEKLQNGYQDLDDGKIAWEDLQALQDEAAEDSIKRLEATGEPIVTDGEQRESSFATYSITDTLAGTGLAPNLAGSPAARSATRPTRRSSSRRTRRSPRTTSSRRSSRPR